MTAEESPVGSAEGWAVCTPEGRPSLQGSGTCSDITVCLGSRREATLAGVEEGAW